MADYKYLKVGAAWVGEMGVSLSVNVEKLTKLKVNDKGDTKLYLFENKKKTEDKQPDYDVMAKNPDYVG